MVPPCRWSLLLAVALVATPALADPVLQMVGTHSLFMKDNPLYPGSRKFSFNVRSKDAPPEHQAHAPLPGTEGDPTADGASGGGGLLVVYNSAGSGESFTVPLPVDQWRVGGDPAGEFRYVFASTPPVWKVYVKGHKISIRGGKGTWGYTLDEPSQGSIAVRLTLGTGITWCSDAQPHAAGEPPSSADYDRPNKFKALRLQPAAAECPPLP
jgi:hypothetical protein